MACAMRFQIISVVATEYHTGFWGDSESARARETIKIIIGFLLIRSVYDESFGHNPTAPWSILISFIRPYFERKLQLMSASNFKIVL